MHKQARARALARQLAARVDLDRTLGARFQPIRLPRPRDLSRAKPAAHAERPRPAPARGQAAEVPAPGARQAAAQARLPSPVHLGAGDLPPLREVEPVADKQAALAPLRDQALACTKCPLARTRTCVVFGEGDLDADLVFVGEAPGRDEDREGRPFVGRAGVLLTRMIEQGMQRPRASVYICNILKCRPPRNRPPAPDEVRACALYLHRQLEVIRPRLIIALGRPAAQVLSGERMSMKRLRGRLLRYRGVPLLPIYHPAFLLRRRGRLQAPATPEDRETWRDLQQAMALLAREADER